MWCAGSRRARGTARMLEPSLGYGSPVPCRSLTGIAPDRTTDLFYIFLIRKLSKNTNQDWFSNNPVAWWQHNWIERSSVILEMNWSLIKINTVQSTVHTAIPNYFGHNSLVCPLVSALCWWCKGTATWWALVERETCFVPGQVLRVLSRTGTHRAVITNCIIAAVGFWEAEISVALYPPTEFLLFRYFTLNRYIFIY